MAIAFARDQRHPQAHPRHAAAAVAYFGGRILQSIVVAAILVVIVLAFGVVFYSVDLPTSKLPAFILALVVGAGALCALGLAISCLVPNEDAAPPVVNGSILPLMFISNIFFSTENAPGWLKTVADFFPLSHLSTALHESFNPFTSGSGIAWTDLLVVAVWGLGRRRRAFFAAAVHLGAEAVFRAAGVQSGAAMARSSRDG